MPSRERPRSSRAGVEVYLSDDLAERLLEAEPEAVGQVAEKVGVALRRRAE